MKHTRNMKLSQRIRTLRSAEHNDLKERMKEIYEDSTLDTGFNSVSDMAIFIGKELIPQFNEENEDYRFFGYVVERYTYNDFVTFTVEFVRKLRLETNKFIDAAIDYEVPGHREVNKIVKKDRNWAAEVQNEMDQKEMMIKGRIDSFYMQDIYAELSNIVYDEFIRLFCIAVSELINRFFTVYGDVDPREVLVMVEDEIKKRNGRIPKYAGIDDSLI